MTSPNTEKDFVSTHGQRPDDTAVHDGTDVRVEPNQFDPRGGLCIVTGSLDDGSFRIIATCFAGLEIGPEEWAVANRLAAAPKLETALQAAVYALRSYQYGNASTELAAEVADRGQATLSKARGGAS